MKEKIKEKIKSTILNIILISFIIALIAIPIFILIKDFRYITILLIIIIISILPSIADFLYNKKIHSIFDKVEPMICEFIAIFIYSTMIACFFGNVPIFDKCINFLKLVMNYFTL